MKRDDTKGWDPIDWPRRSARSSPSLEVALDSLRGGMDEISEGFALPEFVAEREAMERAACAALVREAGCAKLPGCGRGLAPESHPMGYGANIATHDQRCPVAIALAIEARGKEGA